MRCVGVGKGFRNDAALHGCVLFYHEPIWTHYKSNSVIVIKTCSDQILDLVLDLVLDLLLILILDRVLDLVLDQVPDLVLNLVLTRSSSRN